MGLGDWLRHLFGGASKIRDEIPEVRQVSCVFAPEGVWLMKALDKLLKVLPPPKRPLHNQGDWAAVEAAVGLRLPPDYKEFIAAYGRGTISNCLEIESPFGLKPDIRQWWTDWAAFYDCVAEYEPLPYPIYPQSGGLLPFGTLGDVDILNWRTDGKPEQWPFVYYDRTEGFFEIKRLTAVEFVLEAVTRRSPLLIRLRSESAFSPPCEFEAHTPEPRYVQLVHPHQVDMEELVERFTSRWPSEEVRIKRGADRIRVLAEPLDGSLGASREGDERTWFQVDYDQSRAAAAEAIVAELLGLGFTVVGRM
jgi:hypothetical protein